MGEIGSGICQSCHSVVTWLEQISSLKQEAFLGRPSRVTGMTQGLEIDQFVFPGACGLHAVVWDLRKVTSRAGQQVRDQAVFCPCQLDTTNRGKYLNAHPTPNRAGLLSLQLLRMALLGH